MKVELNAEAKCKVDELDIGEMGEGFISGNVYLKTSQGIVNLNNPGATPSSTCLVRKLHEGEVVTISV